MDFIIGFVLGGVVTIFYVRTVIKKAMQQVLDGVELDSSAEDQSPKKRVEAKVEQHDDQFFLFRADNDGFIMQGASMQDFQSRLRAMKIDELSIVNGASEAAKSLIKVSERLKEQSETSNNQ